MDQPQSDWPWVAASRVIDLLAFRRETPPAYRSRYDRPAWAEPIMEKWGLREWAFGAGSDHPLVQDMLHILARVAWWESKSQQEVQLQHAPAPLDRTRRACVRKLARMYRKPVAALLSELQADLDEAANAKSAWNNARTTARQALCRAIAERTLIAWGRPGIWRTKRFTGGDHIEIPPTFFATPDNSILDDDWATASDESPLRHWADRQDQGWTDWGDVRFERSGLIAVWPGIASFLLANVSDLSQAWTLKESIAWIMLRDPAVVWDTAPETERPPAPYRVKRNAPGAAPMMATEYGRPGNSLLRLDLLLAARLAGNPHAPGCSSDEAKETLLAALRAGRLIARGRLPSGVPGEIAAEAWRMVVLEGGEEGDIVAHFRRELGPHWHSVRIARIAVLTEWPPLPDLDHPASLPSEASSSLGIVALGERVEKYTARPQGRPGFVKLALAEFDRRVALGVTWRSKSDCARDLLKWVDHVDPPVKPRSAKAITNRLPSWRRGKVPKKVP